MDFSEPYIAFGIDIGGSGIKGAPVDLRTGKLLAKRTRIPTPRPATPEAVAEVISTLTAHFELPRETRIGITFPGIIQHGVCRSAANMDGDWIGLNIAEFLRERNGIMSEVMNDADAAGYAETLHGAGRDVLGLVLTLTLGTGIGSALVHNGILVPNLELGHLEIDGHHAETRAAASAKNRENLSYPQWAARLQRYLEKVEFLFSPDLFIIGGGISKDYEKFFPLLDIRTAITPAELRNQAGIVGAAALAAANHEAFNTDPA